MTSAKPLPRALLDTNVLVSYLLNPAAPSGAVAVIAHALAGAFTPVIAEDTLGELRRRVAEKPYLAQRIPSAAVEAFVVALAPLSEAVGPMPRPMPAVGRDPKDDYLIAAAVFGAVDYLVTGDADLLVLEQVGRIPVISPAAFVALLLARPADET